MKEVERSVGRVRKVIEKLGLAEYILIVLASHHGAWINFQDQRIAQSMVKPVFGVAMRN